MSICKKCEKEFTPTKGLISYCSLECRNSRVWTEEDKKKKSESAKNSEKVISANKLTATTRASINPEYWVNIKKIRAINRKELILNTNFDDLKFEQLRERIIYEQDCKCNKCNLNEWLGNQIPLELEHKDGNHFNNKRENIEMLCPNCHALTTTWRGRNKKNINVGRISDEKLLETLLINEWNFRQSLIALDLAAKGGNYKRCHRLKNEYNNL